MSFLLPQVLRKRWDSPHGNAEARGRFPVRRLGLVLVILSGLAASLYAYALHRRRAAQTAVAEERFDEAQRHVDFCLLVWPRSLDVHLLAARTARLRGDFQGAESHLNRCLKLNGGATEAIQVEFLLLRVQGGEVDRLADELLSRYVDNRSPHSALILDTLARAYLQDLRYGPAFACLSRWHELDPHSAQPLRWRGLILERLNDRRGAIAEYEQALELDPRFDFVRLRLADLYLERSLPLPALSHLQRLQNENPNRPEVWARLGQCRFLQGHLDEARSLLEAAERQLPHDPAVLLHLAKLALQAEPPQPEEAQVWLQRLLADDPTDITAEALLVTTLHAQGRFSEAQAMRERHERDEKRIRRVSILLREEADKPIVIPEDLTEIGTLFIRVNERVGRYWLHRALEQDPDYQPALQALVDYYENKGEAEKAAPYRRKLGRVRK